MRLKTQAVIGAVEDEQEEKQAMLLTNRAEPFASNTNTAAVTDAYPRKFKAKTFLESIVKSILVLLSGCAAEGQ